MNKSFETVTFFAKSGLAAGQLVILRSTLPPKNREMAES
jgi:hypothetical protein